MVADPQKFPSGIPALVEYVHNAGLLFGIYTDVGSLTCGGQPGLAMDVNLTNQQYKKDIAQFAEWDIDALKVDGCYEDPSIMNITYPALSEAINASNHAMWLSCSWPCYVGGCGGGPSTIDQKVYDALPTYCNTWRAGITTGFSAMKPKNTSRSSPSKCSRSASCRVPWSSKLTSSSPSSPVAATAWSS